jgi:CCR4-NOT transcription complex subunit 6
MRGTKQQMMVANAHLHWNPIYKDVKVMQAAMLMEEIKRMSLT